MLARRMIVGTVLVVLVWGLVSTEGEAKSVYVVTEGDTEDKCGTVKAYEISGDTISYQEEAVYSTIQPLGLAIDPDSGMVFVTAHEGTSGWNDLKMINAKSMAEGSNVEAEEGPFDVDGIVWDKGNKRLYCLERIGLGGGNELIVYRWDADVKRLKMDSDRITLGGLENGLGIALEEGDGRLYVTNATETVYVYDVSNNFAPDSAIPTIQTEKVALAIAAYNDGAGNKYIYTGAADVEGHPPGWSGHTYIVRTEITSSPSSTPYEIDVQVIGLGVDQDTGYVYATTRDPEEIGEDQFDIRWYDKNINYKGTEGPSVNQGAAGICVPDGAVAYLEPAVDLTVTDTIEGENECVNPTDEDKDEITYTIGYDSQSNITYAELVAHLPAELDLYDSDPEGEYDDSDPYDRKIKFELVDLTPSSSGTIYLYVTVEEGAEPGGEITLMCDLETETSYAYAEVSTSVCSWTPDSTIIYVDEWSPVSPGTGESWRSAYVDLQDALDRAISGTTTEIRVASGTYRTGGVNEKFTLVNDVDMSGGYAGYNDDSRDLDLYETILDGDLMGTTAGADTVTIVYADNLSTLTEVDGFTIKNSTSTGEGGIKVRDSLVRVSNCIIEKNGERGIYCSGVDSTVTVTDCRITDNGGQGSGDGGGIRAYNLNELTISDCTVNGNYTSNRGGGIYLWLTGLTSCAISNCIISDNTAEGRGGGIVIEADKVVRIENCIITGNKAGGTGVNGRGGGICAQWWGLEIVNCLIAGNEVPNSSGEDSGGGGIYVQDTGSDTSIVNCTIADNRVGDNMGDDGNGGGIFVEHVPSQSQTIYVENCVVWGNKKGDSDENIYAEEYVELEVSYSDVGGWPGGTGNKDANPLFVEPGSWYDDTWVDGDYRLQANSPVFSPCIDVGDNTAVPAGVTTDLDGKPRFIDRPDVDDGGNGNPPIVDMGAYEVGLSVDLSLDNKWMYQNLPSQENSDLTASVSSIDDPWENNSYSYAWEIILPYDVSLVPTTVDGGDTSDAYWTFAARDCDEPAGLSDSGQTFTVRVTVTGDYGDTGTAQRAFGIALLGDINNDTIVDVADRAIVNGFWRTGSAGPWSSRDCDLNCDGEVELVDRVIANAIWRGELGQDSVSTKCPFRPEVKVGEMVEIMVSQWEFEEGSGSTAGDSAYINDGDITEATWTTGKMGGALEFDGDGDYVKIEDHESIDFNDSITISAWIKVDGWNDNSPPNWNADVIARKDNAYILYRYWDNIDFYLYGPDHRLSYPKSNIELDKWYHIAATYDLNDMKMYVNGVEVVSESESGTVSTSPKDLVVGAQSNGSGKYFNGTIDDVRVYEWGLSSDEIRWLYMEGALVSHWEFDEGTGTTAYDSAGGNDGTVCGDANWTSGQIDGALEFYGDDEYVDVGDVPALDITGDEITVTAWFKPASSDGAVNINTQIVSKWLGTNSAYTLGYDYLGETNTLMFVVYTGTNGVAYGSTAVDDTSKWYHLTGVYDGSEVIVYIDGVAGTPVSHTGNIYNSSMPLRISGYGNGAQTVDGVIDDVRVYNRALSDEEVEALYEAGAGM